MTVHLSNTIQAQLDKLNSPVKVSAIINGTLPDKYAFIYEGSRRFITEFADNENMFSIVLYEWNDEQKYNYCSARGILRDIERLATVIDHWVVKQKCAAAIKHQFDELELFEDFAERNPNRDIENAWTKVKNMFFKDLTSWKTPEWNSRYLELLQKAKEHPAFQNLYPFTSHYWLRFSVDKDRKETWELGTYIIPTVYSEEVPETLGKFYVSCNDNYMEGRFFETINEALDFYADKLRETKPIHWVD